MKSRIGEFGKNSYRGEAPATRTGLREVAPAVFSQDGVNTVTLERTRGRTILANSRLHTGFEHRAA